MNEKEKKAIEDSKELIEELSLIKDENFIERLYYKNKPIEEILQTLLNLIEDLQFTVECRDRVHEYDVRMIDEVKGECVKQCKIIREMAEMLVKDHEWFFSEFDDYTAEDFIEYFTKKVGE